MPSLFDLQSPGPKISQVNSFHNALSVGQCVSGLHLTTLREFTMLQLMNHLTDKPGWETKVFDETIASKWKTEALAAEGRDISQEMVNWVIDELRYKAKIFQQTGAVSIYNGDVVKSDSAVPDSLKEALRSAVKPLEDIPEVHKDYHPGSDGRVVDLVHPSLFPLISERSRVLMESPVGLKDCIQKTGLGERIKRPQESNHNLSDGSYSRDFQWLPCEVKFSGQDGTARIASYINNLHPQKYQDLYAAIEQIITRAVPLWNMTLTPLKDDRYQFKRIQFFGPIYDPDPESLPKDQRPQQGPNELEDDFYEREWEWMNQYRHAHVVQPEPGIFEPPTKSILATAVGSDDENIKRSDEDVNLQRDYIEKGLQVIVKLATISLTPDKPSYQGGAWHVEGQMNEHICASALYYYDSANITESHLAFRQSAYNDDVPDINYEQGDWAWSGPIFGLENGEPCVQDVGDVTCKEGRLLTFPNTLQHCVQPFELVDASKPGYRKLLALFLVDPNIRVISTANVPPQQRDWWSEEVLSTGCFDRLAKELQDKIIREVDDFPIGLDEAKEIRLKLMEERKKYLVKQNESFAYYELSLCEH